MNSKFLIPSKVYWKEHDDSEEEDRKILIMRDTIVKKMKTNIGDLFMDYCRLYLKDVQHQQSPIGDTQMRELTKILLNWTRRQPQNEQEKLINNFSIEFAETIYRKFDATLNYRTYEKKNDNKKIYQYFLSPSNIQRELERLFNAVRFEMGRALRKSDQYERLVQVIKICSQFLGTFLYIHPYDKCNGRVARFLTSYLLTTVTFVPIPLIIQDNYSSKKQLYLECLYERDYLNPSMSGNPEALARFIMDRVRDSYLFIIASI